MVTITSSVLPVDGRRDEQRGTGVTEAERRATASRVKEDGSSRVSPHLDGLGSYDFQNKSLFPGCFKLRLLLISSTAFSLSLVSSNHRKENDKRGAHRKLSPPQEVEPGKLTPEARPNTSSA